MTVTTHDNQLGEIYPTMLNELNCTFGVSFFHVFISVAVMVMVCGRHGIGPIWLGPWLLLIIILMNGHSSTSEVLVLVVRESVRHGAVRGDQLGRQLSSTHPPVRVVV